MNQNNPPSSNLSDDEFASLNAGGNVTDPNSLSLEEINKLTGRDYQDIETARAAIKNAYSMHGKVGQLERELEELKKNGGSDSQRIQQIETDLFYANNPEYKPYRETIAAMGGNPAEVVEKEAFKKVFIPASEFEKSKNAKSVLDSNPRIGQAKTSIESAKELSQQGKHSEAASAASAAVLQAYEQ